MKPLLLIPILSVPLLFSACETLIVDEPVRRSAYVERDVRYGNTGYDRRDHRYDRRDDRYDRRRDDVVVVKKNTAYRPQTTVRYYNDTRGRYYIRDGRRVYSDAGVVVRY